MERKVINEGMVEWNIETTRQKYPDGWEYGRGMREICLGGGNDQQTRLPNINNFVLGKEVGIALQ